MSSSLPSSAESGGRQMTLPSGPATLCFDKDEFMRTDFYVDKFVMECRRRVPLETLRDDLHMYLKILKSAMIELINKDYADFVNLSTNLVGMDKAINNLTVPLGQFKEEVMSVTFAMNGAISAVEGKLKQREKVKEKKVSLQRLINIVQSLEKTEQLLGLSPNFEAAADNSTSELNGQLIERVATEFNKLQFYVTRSRGLPLVEEVKPRIANITSTLQYSLEGSFLEGLDQGNANVLRQCLRTYALIDKIKDAETLFQKHVVKPYMEEVIGEDFIRACPQGLKGMYGEVLAFIPKHCQILKDVTSAGSPGGEIVRGYDFLVNAVWPEIVSNIEARTSSIFAPGNPNVFQEKFSTSMEFVEKFEYLCGSQASVKRLRNHSSYNLFMSKWSLPVYFQIRFQEIAGSFESALVIGFNRSTEDSQACLSLTSVLWHTIIQCWGDAVFLSPLVHRFWKLTLQLLARYCSWLDEVLDAEMERKGPGNGERNEKQPAPGSREKVNGVERTHNRFPDEKEPKQPSVTLGQVLCLIADAERTAEKIFEIFENYIWPKLECVGYQNKDSAKSCFEDAKESILCRVPKFQSLVINEVTNQSSLHLKQVADIPRLYRRTNREVPSKPSTYSTGLFKPLKLFFDEHQEILDSHHRTSIAEQVFRNLAEQYSAATSDVLTSVKKTEDSLKRLKKARGTGSSVGTQGMSDDDKIRRQLIIDIDHYGQQVETFGLEKSSVDGYQQLLNLREEAKAAMTSPLS